MAEAAGGAHTHDIPAAEVSTNQSLQIDGAIILSNNML